MRFIVTSAVVLITSVLTHSQSDPLVPGWHDENKLIVVTTPDWNSDQGILTRYQRRVTGDGGRGTESATTTLQAGKWQQVGEPIPVVVGHSGLAWDPAIEWRPPGPDPGPVKHEGDGRSPAGFFQLNRGTFGFAPSLRGSRMYTPLTPSIECVDDPASRYYAQIVDRERVDRVDWNSSEKMRSVPGYAWGVVVNYNMDQRVRGYGSCIFLHQWSGPAIGTAGCTAMSAEDIEAVVRWVAGEDRTVLVELPLQEYKQLRRPWHLP